VKPTRETHPFLRFQLPAILWAVVIFIASSIPQHSIPQFALLSQDKLLHLLVYFIFTGLLYVALIHQTRFPLLARRPDLWAALIAGVYGVTDEVHQSFVGRSADVLDLVADLAGALLLVAVVTAIRILQRARAR
jgi:VanZ family protein